MVKCVRLFDWLSRRIANSNHWYLPREPTINEFGYNVNCDCEFQHFFLHISFLFLGGGGLAEDKPERLQMPQ